MLPIVLASSSPYRQQLLRQLGIPFSSASPEVDETPSLGESAHHLAGRLAAAKAAALAQRFPSHLIIGADQVAMLGQRLLGKPGNHQQAIQQLTLCSGQRVSFLTGLSLLNSKTGEQQTQIEPFSVQFRPLSSDQINRYLEREQPFDCAGSFRVEGLGISLFESLQGDDPNALIGLPLIRLCDMLNRAGWPIP